MKISKKITLPVELTNGEDTAIEDVKDLLGEMLTLLETYDCDRIGNRESGKALSYAEISDICTKLEILSYSDLEIYKEE